MKLLICGCLTTLLFTPPAADGSTIILTDFTGSGENVVLTASFQPMISGSGLVRIGYFLDFVPLRLDCSQVSPSGIFSYINTNFVPLGEGLPGLGTPSTQPGFYTRTVGGIPQSGRLFGAITGVAPTAAPPNTLDPGNGVPAGSRFFLLIFDQATMGSSTQMGIFSATTWLMPSNPSVNATIATPAIDTYAEVFVGSLGSLVLSPGCPEPGTATLTFAAAGALLARRRVHRAKRHSWPVLSQSVSMSA